jgi:outer membrane receptor protein involved in Fe transport
MKMKQILLVVLVLLSLVSVVMAQTFTGTVIGRVLDPQQAIVPAATVILKNTATGAERRATSNNDGDYSFPAVSPGKYTVSAEARGFSLASVNVEVTVAASTRVDIILGIKGVEETVTIGEAGVAVQTEDAQLGNTVSQRQIAELPTINRDPYAFIALSAGVTPSSDSRALGIGFAINGQRSASGNYILDGGENNDTFIAAPAQTVPLDTVQEFRVQTNNYTAEYGRGVGFIANVVTKSGTNEFHGSLYEFNRNSKLSANTLDNNANNLKRPVFNRNQFGGTFGGPVNENKLFFFGSFEPIFIRSSAPVSLFVPTPQLLAISSPAIQAIFQKYPLPNGLSTTNVRTRTVCPFGAPCDPTTGAGLVTIPAFAFVSRTGPQDAGAGPPQDTYLATGRIDYNVNMKTQLFGRYAFENRNFFAGVDQPYSAALDQPARLRNQNLLLNLTSWSSKLVTESRVVYNRVPFAQPQVPAPNGFPFFRIANESVTLPSGGTSFGGPQNLYQFFQTVSLIKRNHIIKFGGQYVHLRDNRTFGAFQNAGATFANVQGFVNGLLSSYTIALDPKGHFPGQQVDPPFGPPSFTRHFHYNEIGLFIQDTWKLTPRLTLSPGLRWEYFGVFHSTKDEKPLDANFYYGQGSTVFERIANGGFLRTIDAPGKYKNHFYLPDYKNFGPRLGLAYDIFGDGKTVFRTGVGVFYDRNFGNVTFNAFQNPPNYSTTRLVNIPLTPAILENQYAVFPNAPVILLGSSARHLDQDLKTAYTVTWNARLEREVKNALVVGATYVGASGNRLYTQNNINRLGSGIFLGRPGTRLNDKASSIQTRGNLGHSSYHGLQLEVNSRYLQNIGLQFGANYTWSHSIDTNSSIFGEDLVANGIGFGINGFTDAFTPRLDRGDSDFDTRHRFVTNFIWDIPVARRSERWYAEYLLGGWAISGLLSFQTGQPFLIADTGNPEFAQDFAVNPRPIFVGPVPPTVLVPDAVTPNQFLFIPINQVFDADFNCLPHAAPFRCSASVNGPFDGTLSRNTFRRPGTQYHHLAVLKNIGLPRILGREGMKLQVRAEIYNAFNHPNLYVTPFTNDVAAAVFNESETSTVPGVATRRGDNGLSFPKIQDSRQIVMAMKFIF